MEVNEVLTNEFRVVYDPETSRLLVFRVVDGVPTDHPIGLRLTTLVDMGPEGASKWVGETVLLLIPEMRKKLFKLSD